MSQGQEAKKRALIVGGSNGVGRGIAASLALEGYEVFVLGRKVDSLNSLGELIAQAGRAKAKLIALDLKRLDLIAPLCAALPRQAIELIVFAKGGNAISTRIVDLKVKDFAEEINASLISCQMLLAGLKEQLKASEQTGKKATVVWLTCKEDGAFRGLGGIVHSSREAMAKAYGAEHNRRALTYIPQVGSGSSGRALKNYATPYTIRHFPNAEPADDEALLDLGKDFVAWLKKQPPV